MFNRVAQIGRLIGPVVQFQRQAGAVKRNLRHAARNRRIIGKAFNRFHIWGGKLRLAVFDDAALVGIACQILFIRSGVVARLKPVLDCEILVRRLIGPVVQFQRQARAVKRNLRHAARNRRVIGKAFNRFHIRGGKLRLAVFDDAALVGIARQVLFIRSGVVARLKPVLDCEILLQQLVFHAVGRNRRVLDFAVNDVEGVGSRLALIVTRGDRFRQREAVAARDPREADLRFAAAERHGFRPAAARQRERRPVERNAVFAEFGKAEAAEVALNGRDFEVCRIQRRLQLAVHGQHISQRCGLVGGVSRFRRKALRLGIQRDRVGHRIGVPAVDRAGAGDIIFQIPNQGIGIGIELADRVAVGRRGVGHSGNRCVGAEIDIIAHRIGKDPRLRLVDDDLRDALQAAENIVARGDALRRKGAQPRVDALAVDGFAVDIAAFIGNGVQLGALVLDLLGEVVAVPDMIIAYVSCLGAVDVMVIVVLSFVAAAPAAGDKINVAGLSVYMVRRYAVGHHDDILVPDRRDERLAQEVVGEAEAGLDIRAAAVRRSLTAVRAGIGVYRRPRLVIMSLGLLVILRRIIATLISALIMAAQITVAEIAVCPLHEILIDGFLMRMCAGRVAGAVAGTVGKTILNRVNSVVDGSQVAVCIRPVEGGFAVRAKLDDRDIAQPVARLLDELRDKVFRRRLGVRHIGAAHAVRSVQHKNDRRVLGHDLRLDVLLGFCCESNLKGILSGLLDRLGVLDLSVSGGLPFAVGDDLVFPRRFSCRNDAAGQNRGQHHNDREEKRKRTLPGGVQILHCQRPFFSLCLISL